MAATHSTRTLQKGHNGLTRAVREQRSLTEDPQLEDLLDQVETRAAVELAKLEGARVAT